MDFEVLEKKVRFHIINNEFREAVSVLEESFKDDSDLDIVIVNLAKYNLLIDNQLKAVVDHDEIDLTLNKLNSSILSFVRAKKEYYQFKKRTFQDEGANHSEEEENITVFFSVASPFNDNQQQFIDRLKEYFLAHGVVLQTLVEWNDDDPIIPILTELKKSAGCLVLALERYYINEGVEKRGSAQEGSIEQEGMTSPWLHIEAAIARSLDLPLLILKEESLKNEGLIHNDKQEWGIVRIKEDQFQAIEQYPIKNFILSWINQVKRNR